MKSILLTAAFIGYTINIVAAQNSASKPVDTVKVDTAKTANKAKMDMAKPAAKIKMTKPTSAVLDSVKMKMAKSSTKMKMTTSPASSQVDSAKSTMKTKMGTHKAHKAKAPHSQAVANPKMHFKCPKGDALCDTGGKCPVCGTEMVAMDPPKMMKKAAKKIDDTEIKKEMKKEVHTQEKKG